MSILYIFDCDGVILDCNMIKSEAFKFALNKYQLPGTNWLIEYNRRYGGMSRHEKFDKYIKKFGLNNSILHDLLEAFSHYTTNRLNTCPVSSFFGSAESERIASASCVVSGGSEEEIVNTFRKRNLLRFFELGIYGNPVSKKMHLQNFMNKMLISKDSVYFGDSRMDFEICHALGIKFTFISEWSEFREWEAFFSDKQVPVYGTLSQAIGSCDAG